MALWHGVLLMVLRAAASTAAENLQRYAQRPQNPRRMLNLFGVLLQVASAPMDAIAYSVAPQSVLAPIGTVGMLFNLVAAQKVHGDALSRRDIAATTLVVVGASMCTLSGSPSDGTGSTPTAAKFEVYVVFVAAFCAALASVLVALRRTCSPRDGFANALLGGVLGSTTVVASKVISSAFLAADATMLSRICALVPIVLLAPTHLYVMNRCCGRYPLVFVSPVCGTAGLLGNVATGAFLYSERPVAPYFFSFGVMLLCCGVLSLCAGRYDVREECDEGASSTTMLGRSPRSPSGVSSISSGGALRRMTSTSISLESGVKHSRTTPSPAAFWSLTWPRIRLTLRRLRRLWQWSSPHPLHSL